MNIIDRVYREMVRYYAGDPHQIQHFVKVHSYAAFIGRQEGLDAGTQEILEIAALVHDIGIKPALEKYGSSAGALQELEGPPAAYEMLSALLVPEETISRVCWLVSRHHTYRDVTGLDHRILLEADFLVNCHEGGFPAASGKAAMNNVFTTKTGTELLTVMFGITEEDSL